MNFIVKSFKSILKEQNIKLENKKLNIFIGQNGIGKTNILESIDWLLNPSSKKVITEKNPYYEGENDFDPVKTEIYMITDLTNQEKQKFSNIFKKYSIDLEFENLNKIEYKNSNIVGNQYNFDFNEFKSAYKILIDKLLRGIYNNGNSWLLSEFFKKTADGKEILYYDNGLNEINNMSINEELKQKHRDLEKDIQEILVWAKEISKCKYIKNADFENNLEYFYSFDQYKNNKNKDFIELLNFVEQGTELFNNLDELMTPTNKDEKETIKKQNQLKKQLETSSNLKIKQLFNAFDIYAYPEVITSDNKFSLIVKDKNNYKIGNEETKFNSSGYKAFFQLIMQAENIRKYAKKNINHIYIYILLADEPDKNLHPNLQIQLVNYLKNLCMEFPNIYIALTTHSPFMLKDLESNFCIVSKDNDGSTILNYWNKSTKKIKVNLLNSFSLIIAASLFNEEKDFASIFLKPNKMFCNYENMNDDDKEKINKFSEDNGISIISSESINNNLGPFFSENNINRIYNLKDLDNIYSKSDILKDIENNNMIIIKKNNNLI